MTIAVRLLAQAQVADALVFTAVAIKPNTSGSGRSNVDFQPGGRFVAINVGVLQMVTIAYGDDGPLTQDRLVVNDKWFERRAVTSAKYDIQATAERDISRPDLQHALRQLLSDRFKLTMHRETRQVPSYEMVFARADSRLGPRLRPSADCTQAEACGFQSFPGRAKGRVTMGDLARRVLPAGVGDGRPILDRTGLTGTFEFDLEWTPDAAAPPRPPDAPPAPPIDPNGSSFVTALREQLGLKLEARSGSIDVVVVDHAERPLPD
jgi:uncharacterized protein (TIGR03435 family)